jgi:hypothetical protein
MRRYLGLPGTETDAKRILAAHGNTEGTGGTPHSKPPEYEILPNDNEKVRERNGRIYVSHRRTWDVLRDGECIRGEFETRREAKLYVDECRLFITTNRSKTP